MIRGFTLVEMVLVLAIMGLLAVAAVISAPSPKAANLMAAARQVQNDIEYAKQNAMMTGVTSGVSFTQNAGYIVYQNTTATPLKSALTKTNLNVTLSANYSNITLNDTYVVEFDGFGAPTTGGGGFVRVTDGTNNKTISVTANTGMVKIQ